METKDFLENIKATGTPDSAFIIIKEVFKDFEDSEDKDELLSIECLPEIYTSVDEMKEECKKIADSLEPNRFEYIELRMTVSDINPEALEDADLDSIDYKWIDVLVDFGSEYVYYDYPSVEGAVLVFWSYQRYVGYCSKCGEIRFGESGETEKLCMPIDEVLRTQCSVLCDAEEVKGLKKEELRKVIYKHLEEKKWRWCNNAKCIADDFLDRL